MKEADDIFQSMALELEEKPTIEESQLSRKARYFQRILLPKPTQRKAKKKKIQEDSSDDEMPTQTKSNPKKDKKKKPKTTSSNSDIEVIDLVTPSPSPRKVGVIDLTMSSDDENFDSVPVEKVETQEEQSTSATPSDFNRVRHLPGRLPKWYSTRKSEREKREKEYAEKRAARVALEKEAAEVAEKEEQKEHRRFRDRLRHQKKREMEKIQKAKEGGDVVKEPKTKKQKPRVEDVEENGIQKRKRAKQTGTMITDPSLDPSIISLDMPELAPWAPRKPKKSREAPPTLNASPDTMTSPDSESPAAIMLIQEQTEEIRRDLEELDKIGCADEIPLTPTDEAIDPLDQIDEPLFFENAEFLRISDDELEIVAEGDVGDDGDHEISEKFISYLIDDNLPIADELDGYLY